MKKTSHKKKIRFILYTRKQRLKSLARRYFKGQVEYNPPLLIAPKILSFSKNSTETISFFEKLKIAIFTKKSAWRKGRAKRHSFRLDLRPIQHISVPAAIVFAAELQRWRLNGDGALRATGLNKWDNRVRSLMYHLGVFELLGIRKKREKADEREQVVLLKLQSGTKLVGEDIDRLQAWFREMGIAYSEKKYVFGALNEAILNCIEHGYLDLGQPPRFPYAGHRWWATSCYDRKNDSLRFFVYDQGIGIPACLPKEKSYWQAIQERLSTISGGSPDANIIESAFEVGRTRTLQAERGKGLDKMRNAIRLAGSGYLRVVSGRGDISLDSEKTMKKHDHALHIGGTLVEWSIPISARQ